MCTNESLDKKITRSKNAFKEALIKLLKEKKFEEISVSDIIKESNYSRSAFYSHYTDKYDFGKKLIKEECETYSNIICNSIKLRQKIIIDDRIYEPALNFFNHVYDNRDLYIIIINSEIPEWSFDEFCENSDNIFKQKVDVEFKSITFDLDRDFYFYCNSYAYMIYVKYWAKNNFKFSPLYMAEQVSSLIRLKKVDSVFTLE